MIIIETGFGDTKEAFIERRLTPGVNVIFSDDNNKGKTLVIQGLMYSLGNEPIFPSGFNYRDCVFYSKCDFDGNIWAFLRKHHSIIALKEGAIYAFDSISEFKRFFNSNIKTLPTIRKDDSKKIVDPELFYQMFFLPQDRRDPSNVISSGYYKKSDFYELIYSISGTGPEPLDATLIAEIKNDLAKLEEERRSLAKRLDFARTHPMMSEIANKSIDKEAAQVKKSTLNSINSSISELKRDRVREMNRKSKLEQLLIELRSLNRELTSGKIICAECGSSKVIFKNEEFLFDVSNVYVRENIINSITAQIKIKEEIIDEKTRLINREQESLNKELQDTPKSLQTILLHAEEILSYSEIDNEIVKIDERIDELKRELENSKNISIDIKKVNRNVIDEIQKEMNSIYARLDPAGTQVFNDIFSKRDQTYSGSEEQEFYFSKLMALNSVLEHGCPIIIDSFRSGELSSNKEAFMLHEFTSLNKQVIVTSTLKSEEYSANHYSVFDDVNAIDYSTNESGHILSANFSEEFGKIVQAFMTSIF